MSLPEQAHARIEAQAGRGEVELGKGIAPARASREGRRSRTGGETLRVYTAHGSLRVDAR